MTWCGLRFDIAASGSTIKIHGNATDVVLWDQIKLRGPEGLHAAVGSRANSTSPTTVQGGVNLAQVAVGQVHSGDVIWLCGPSPTGIVLDQAAWPYAVPHPWDVELPACEA